jgi:hypothetical protein
MLRQNRSEGSSTSRSFAKPALFPALRKTFQFSDEQCPRYIFMAEPLFLIPSVPAEVQESGPHQRCHTFFGRNHFSSCRPPVEPVRLEGNQGNRVRKAGPPHYFRGNHFSSFLPAETGAAGSTDIGRRGDRRMFFAGTTFPHSVGFHVRPVGPDSLQQFFSSPSLQGGSGIPAVPKTGASVLRLLPPTS